MKKITRKVRILLITSSALVMMAAGGFFYYLNFDDQSVAKRYLDYDPGIYLPGPAGQLSLQAAMVNYKKGDFEKSAVILNALQVNSRENDTLLYYYGVTLLMMNDWQNPGPYFQAVLNIPGSVFHYKSRYRLGLINWRNEENKIATEIFHEIEADPKDPYRKKAILILRQID